jgi:putative transposase
LIRDNQAEIPESQIVNESNSTSNNASSNANANSTPLALLPNPDLSVQAMCRCLGVSKSGYDDWIDRKPCKRSEGNAKLLVQMRQIHQMSDATYGAPRMHAELVDTGHAVNYKRVERLMRLHALVGVSRRRGYIVTTRRDPSKRPAPDLVKRQFVADAPNQLWVADMTYLPTHAGFAYLATVLDVYSRKIVGWAFGSQMKAQLVTAALNMAALTRKPQSVIHHSDQGSQYTSVEPKSGSYPVAFSGCGDCQGGKGWVILATT